MVAPALSIANAVPLPLLAWHSYPSSLREKETTMNGEDLRRDVDNLTTAVQQLARNQTELARQNRDIIAKFQNNSRPFSL
jgi:phage terminase Nu1 subunit (DNA packaging protein)